jgi:hypothetical protein
LDLTERLAGLSNGFTDFVGNCSGECSDLSAALFLGSNNTLSRATSHEENH